jgi:hypothetical protein
MLKYKKWIHMLPGAAVVAAIVFLTIVSCADDKGFKSVDDYNVVVTLFDQDFNFGDFATFSMPDSVVHLRIPEKEATDNITWVYDSHILSEVVDLFESSGYQKVDPHVTTPDFFVLVSVTKQNWLEFPYEHHWWVNWSWYTHWPSLTDTWDVTYPVQYTDEPYSFSQGTLFIDIMDAKNRDATGEKIPIRWTAVINGVLGYTDPKSQNRIITSIKQAIEQSPYLDRN